MTSILKVDTIQTAAGGTPTAADLGLNVTGSVLQVVSTQRQPQQTISSMAYNTVYTAQITPKSASSKILIVASCLYWTNTGTDHFADVTLFRDSTNLGSYVHSGLTWFAHGILYRQTNEARNTHSFNYLDAPNTTNTITYKYVVGTSGTVTVGYDSDNYLTLMEIAG